MQKSILRPDGKRFLKRYKEHHLSFTNNSASSRSAQHLLEHFHMFGPTDKAMQILHLNCNGNHLDTLERFYTYKQAISDKHLNNKHTVSHNKFLKLVPTKENNITCSLTPHTLSFTPHTPVPTPFSHTTSSNPYPLPHPYTSQPSYLFLF